MRRCFVSYLLYKRYHLSALGSLRWLAVWAACWHIITDDGGPSYPGYRSAGWHWQSTALPSPWSCGHYSQDWTRENVKGQSSSPGSEPICTWSLLVHLQEGQLLSDPRARPSAPLPTIRTFPNRSYLKSEPSLLPLSGTPGSGHILCPWDTPTWVTTRQKTAHTETGSHGKAPAGAGPQAGRWTPRQQEARLCSGLWGCRGLRGSGFLSVQTGSCFWQIPLGAKSKWNSSRACGLRGALTQQPPHPLAPDRRPEVESPQPPVTSPILPICWWQL